MEQHPHGHLTSLDAYSEISARIDEFDRCVMSAACDLHNQLDFLLGTCVVCHKSRLSLAHLMSVGLSDTKACLHQMRELQDRLENLSVWVLAVLNANEQFANPLPDAHRESPVGDI